MVTVRFSVTRAMRVYIALQRERERHRMTLRDLLGRGADADSFEVRVIADALAETDAAIKDVDVALYPAPYPTEEALA